MHVGVDLSSTWSLAEAGACSSPRLAGEDLLFKIVIGFIIPSSLKISGGPSLARNLLYCN